ncbi:MAG: hypothetical protein ACPG77_02300, partial [Nannocystaceae bacterium]
TCCDGQGDQMCAVGSAPCVVNKVLAVDESPESVNESPYTDGWLLQIKPSDASQYEGLLDAASYRKLVAEETD